MSLITTIDGIPLYSTRREALAWAAANGLSGYHTHTYQGKLGFMGGATHSKATTPTAPTVTTPTVTTPNVTSTPSTNSGGGGY
jgi:hypothetical protein